MKKLILILLLLNSAVLPQMKTNSAAPSQELFAPVRGVWLTNVDSDALSSKDNIVQTVNCCESLGINTIFVVTWNKAMTLYPSRVMEGMFGEAIDPNFPGRDPLKELIEEAHKKNIKVIAWFEFGFSSSYMLNGGRLIKLKPHWASRSFKGEIVQKNGFEWMNGFDPEVQDFMLSLILEVVRNYDIDGIQGDDRLPAMPVEAGYEDYTVELYKKEHNGSMPPADHKNAQWVDWRAGKLNDFMKRIHDSVKTAKANVIVSMAPSIFPWSKEEYLQDWPAWLRDGLVDMVCPQIYRYDIKDYVKSLDLIVNKQIRREDLKKFFPGVLLKLGTYYPAEDYLKSVISENRKRGVEGEVYFFYEGLKKFPELFRNAYKTKQ